MMNSEIEVGLENVDPEDIEDLLKKAEKSFDITFKPNELAYVTTFGQLSDHIINKIKLEEADGCTSQQAFYKLQDALSEVLCLEKKSVTPKLLLKELLPPSHRKRIIKELEFKLGFRLNILSPPIWIILTMFLTFVISGFLFFWDWRVAVSGLVISIVGFILSNKLGRELGLNTVGELAEKMSWENYLKSRRKSSTVNKKELEKLLTSWFKSDLVLDKLDRESAINR